MPASGSDAIKRHEKVVGTNLLGSLGHRAALLVAVLAVCLAVSEMRTSAVGASKVTAETRLAGVRARQDINEVKAAMRRIGPQAAAAERRRLQEGDRDLTERIYDSSAKYKRFAYANVAIQVAIVLASASVLVGVGWLLLGGAGALFAALLITGVV